MRKGTTPTHIFTIPFDTAIVKEALVVYAQDDKEVFRKETYDCMMDGKHIGVKLTQDDTLRFNHSRNVQVQLQVLTTEGDSYVSDVWVIRANQCLNNEVLL